MKRKKTIAVVGAGAAALMLAALIDEKKYILTVYEQNQAAGRKLLVAGKGGFNLTHSEDLPAFVNRYIPNHFFEPLLRIFSNQDLIRWLNASGIPTFCGSSKRIFPAKGIKPVEVLNAFLRVLASRQVEICYKHRWTGWNETGGLMFVTPAGAVEVKADIVVYALGGASWKVTGSDGSWADRFRKRGIQVNTFRPSNCAFGIAWPPSFLDAAEGLALKNISAACGDMKKPGEAVITRFGLEGGAVYALSEAIRKEMTDTGKAMLYLDLKPAFPAEEIQKRLSNPRGTHSWSKHLESQLGLDKAKMALLKNVLSKADFMNPPVLAAMVKSFPLLIHSAADIDDAISTAGGIDLSELDATLQLKQMPGHFAIGEMLDWDAPTGGYLLQGCFSMGAALATWLNA